MTDVLIPASQWRPVDITREMLEGREAQCPYCKKTEPSIEFARLAFFEYRGPGNTRYCDHCGWAECCHARNATETRDGVPWNTVADKPCHVKDHAWSDEQGREFDSYYCGCRGWD